LALTVAECDAIAAAAESSGVLVGEAVMYLYHPLLHKAQQLVKEGALGQVTTVRGAHSYFLARLQDVRWHTELGGGSLWDVGSYPVSFIRWVAGEPEYVFGWQTRSASGVDSTFTGLLRYDNGVLGVFDCGFRQQYRAQAEVTGTEGTLIIERPYRLDAPSRIVIQRGFEEEEITVPLADPYQCQVEAISAAYFDGAPLPVTLDISRANVATLVALYRSAELGKPMPIPET
jgi:predicted dehydrogenase